MTIACKPDPRGAGRRCSDRLDGVVNGLRDDPAVLDDEGVSTVPHARVRGLGLPLQEGDPAFYEAIGVHVGSVGELFGEQACEVVRAIPAVEDPPAGGECGARLGLRRPVGSGGSGVRGRWRCPLHVEEEIVGVAPPPVLSWFVRPNQWMVGVRAVVGGGVPVR